MGAVFSKLLKEHFPTIHVLRKILHKNIVKIKYSCIKNINSAISSHSKNILNPKTELYRCNCWYEESFPLNRECLTPQAVYRTIVTNVANEDIKITSVWQISHLKKNIVTTKEISSVRNTVIPQN